MHYFSLLLFLCLVGCNHQLRNKTALQVHLQRTVVLDSLSSGSGLVFSNNGAFVLSDNMNGFFKLDTATLQYSFQGFDLIPAFIKTKDVKEDFESATCFTQDGRQWIIAFGSGSVTNSREHILFVPVDTASRFSILPAADFYKAIKENMGITTEQLNLEGCFASADSFYLLNRGTNQSIVIGITDMQNSMASNFTSLPAMRIQNFLLPIIDGFNASFSGACFYNEAEFIFSATVEKTNNWVDDGEVAGSFIGIANINGTVKHVVPLKDERNQMIKEKIESIEWVKGNKGEGVLYAISDNDNGKSTWFLIELKGLPY